MSQIMIPVSWGELLDKITILEIKARKISDENARQNVLHELDELGKIWGDYPQKYDKVKEEVDKLRKVNTELWEIEDDIRVHERNKDFGAKFIELARSVYHINDLRGTIKKQINQALGSDIVEEKNYESY